MLTCEYNIKLICKLGRSKELLMEMQSCIDGSYVQSIKKSHGYIKPLLITSNKSAVAKPHALNF